MSYKNVIISSGHGNIVRGASAYLDEVNEARRVVDLVAEKLRRPQRDGGNFPRRYEHHAKPELGNDRQISQLEKPATRHFGPPERLHDYEFPNGNRMPLQESKHAGCADERSHGRRWQVHKQRAQEADRSLLFEPNRDASHPLGNLFRG